MKNISKFNYLKLISNAGIVLMLYFLAELTWRIALYFTSDSQSLKTTINTSQSRNQSTQKVNNNTYTDFIGELNSLNLFGLLPENIESKGSMNQIVNQPKTSLPLKLNGILVSNDPLKSIAIIEYKKTQNSYFIGDEIVNGVDIINIQNTGVLINENGNQTLLSYEKIDSYNKSGNQNQKTNSNNTTEIDVELRDELLASPQKLLDYVSISPVKENEKLIGYRVNPGKNAQLFEVLGFKAGDIAIEINGVDLTNEIESLSLLSDIDTITFASVHVKRNDEVHIIDVNLSQ